ncbi:MAG: Cu2+-exporting ATPase, partial [Lachnospiraceae bacterium]|nr:Cu2+-exporting ATPase [Lachnospiraceae bacterium]
VLLYILQIFLSLSVIFINRRLFAGGIISFIRLAPNIDSLVVIGASAAFIYSTVISLINVIYYKNADEYIGESELYFESCAMILTLVAVGKLLEEVAKGKTSNALKDLSDMSPKTALLLVNGQEKEVPIEDVKVGDVFILKPGMNIPVDGVIESGTSAVN